MAINLSGLRTASLYSQGRFLVLIFVRSLVKPSAILRLEGLAKLKKKIMQWPCRDNNINNYIADVMR
jgi:hypothetical protein